MKYLNSILIIWLSLVLKSSFLRLNHMKPHPLSLPSNGISTLKLVHIVFRHGNRNPDKGLIWKGNSYENESYYPEGWGQLTNKGKLTAYKLGQFYRKRYDPFLGNIWNINYIELISTNIDRTKMSGQLVMAGLWPKNFSIWNKGLWQSVPHNISTDNKLLLGMLSPDFKIEFAKVYGSPKIQGYLSNRYSRVMHIMSKYTGCSTTDYLTAIIYYDIMKVQDDLGFKMEKWTKHVYPEPLKSLAIDMFYTKANTTNLRKIMAGPLLEKILLDTQNFIEGTLSPSTRKMFVYSAHDVNVAIYLFINAAPMIQTPPYGSSVLFEVHQINNIWGVKVFLHDYSKGSPHHLSIPGCTHFCPFDKFYNILKILLPAT